VPGKSRLYLDLVVELKEIGQLLDLFGKRFLSMNNSSDFFCAKGVKPVRIKVQIAQGYA
jgi:hypothetical protein